MKPSPRNVLIVVAVASVWMGHCRADDGADRMCSTPLLTTQEQFECHREINTAASLGQLRQAQQKFQEAIKRAREADAKKATNRSK